MTKLEHAVFGQELYYEESIRAIESFRDVPGHDGLTSSIAELLPHPSKATRLRIAAKIIQRFFRSPDGGLHAAPFPDMVTGLKTEADRRDLLYWRTARVDTIIAAIAREVLHPYFVLGELPRGYDEAAFRMANHASLFSIDRVISLGFATEYARHAWGFSSARTVTLALRIMRQARVLDAVNTEMGEEHALCYYPLPHSLSPWVFAYCVHEEFIQPGDPPLVSLDKIYNGDCARLFLLSPLQADSMLRALERRGTVERTSLHGAGHIRFSSSDLASLVSDIIDSKEPKQ